MPKQTFFNLPAFKRQRLVDLALGEFAEHGPTAASISRIVAQAGIAKGSLYQYFTDKQDLFLYLVDLSNEERIRFMTALRPLQPGEPFFPYIRWVMEQSATFRYSDPRYARMITWALSSDHAGLGEATRRVRQTIATVWGGLIRQGLHAGEIDREFDPTFLVWVLTTLTLDLRTYLQERPQPDPGAVSTANYFSAYSDLVRLLENGIRPDREGR